MILRFGLMKFIDKFNHNKSRRTYVTNIQAQIKSIYKASINN